MGKAWENPTAGGPPAKGASKLKYKYLETKKKGLPGKIYNPPIVKKFFSYVKIICRWD